MTARLPAKPHPRQATERRAGFPPGLGGDEIALPPSGSRPRTTALHDRLIARAIGLIE
jgi:hypothetical protein